MSLVELIDLHRVTRLPIQSSPGQRSRPERKAIPQAASRSFVHVLSSTGRQNDASEADLHIQRMCRFQAPPDSASIPLYSPKGPAAWVRNSTQRATGDTAVHNIHDAPLACGNRHRAREKIEEGFSHMVLRLIIALSHDRLFINTYLYGAGS